MTTKEKLIQMIYNCAVSQPDAEAIFEYARPAIEELPSAHNFAWQDDCEGYPQILYNLMFGIICAKAVEWFEANRPEAIQKIIFQQLPHDLQLATHD